MRILFILENVYHEYCGPMILSAVLKKEGHVVDCLCEQYDLDIYKGVKIFNPDIVAFSTTTGFHKHYLEIARKIKEQQNVFTIFGGPHPTFFPDIIEDKAVDFICVGEGEYPFLELVFALENSKPFENIENIWVKTNGKILKNTYRNFVQNLDELPFPDRELFHKYGSIYNETFKTFLSGRGCPYQCSYCFNHKYMKMFKGKYIRRRSVDNVISEILQVQKRYGLSLCGFLDDIFTMDQPWLEEFADKYSAALGVPFYCNVRANHIDEEKADLLKKARCCFAVIGLESGDDFIRREILKKDVTSVQIKKAADLLHERNIDFVTNNILAVPEETPFTLLNTLKLNVECRSKEVMLYYYRPFPGTELGKYSIDKGYFDGNYDAIPHRFDDVGSLSFTLKTPYKFELTQIVKLFHFLFDFPRLIPFVEWVIGKPILKYLLYGLRLINHFYTAKTGFKTEEYFSRLNILEKQVEDMELVEAENNQKIMKSYAPDLEIVSEKLYLVQLESLLIEGKSENVQLFIIWLSGLPGMEQEIVRTYQPIRNKSRLRKKEVIADFAPYNATKLRIGYCVNNPDSNHGMSTKVFIQKLKFAKIRIVDV
jgi:anaerobic magnesium-protoporphyrin IX monomethyl ester cyclase